MKQKMTLNEIREKAAGIPLEQAVQWLADLVPQQGIQVAKLADIYSRKLHKLNEERSRIQKMSQYEIIARTKGYVHIGGVDEAGRGPLAGPVVASCVVLPQGCFIEQLNDSKKLSPVVRDKLFDRIMAEAVDYGIGMVMSDEIDQMNILNATRKAMVLAVSQLKTQPDYLIIDAVKLSLQIEQLSIFKADSLSISVAAASILAKVTRDRWMEQADKQYPGYNFSRHKGYGTEDHIQAIRANGLCPIHRRTFTRQWVDEDL
ncbi:MAG: ribonuclease HII [Thermoclostridium sp.]|nr:ribonuclease HII [Thermoclostridium sp.]